MLDAAVFDTPGAEERLCLRGDYRAAAARVRALARREKELIDQKRQIMQEIDADTKPLRKDASMHQSLAWYDRVRSGSERLSELDAELMPCKKELYQALGELPNIPADDAPARVLFTTDAEKQRGASGTAVHRIAARLGMNGTDGAAQAEAAHVIAARLGLSDLHGATTVARMGFQLLTGEGPRLSRACAALLRGAFEAEGYAEVMLPALICEDALFAAAELPFRREALYPAKKKLFVPPVSCAGLIAMRGNEIMDEAALPMRFFAQGTGAEEQFHFPGSEQRAYTAAAAFFRDGDGAGESGRLCERLRGVFHSLGIPFRIVTRAARELPAAAERAVAVEVFLPAQGRWETAAQVCGCGTYLGRRAGIRTRAHEEDKPRPAEVVTALLYHDAVLAAVLEEHYQAPGVLELPPALGGGRLPAVE